ncbi:hypothetical protein E1265_32510 [Streptomyces sp. 8K308]|uniref:hypothetical protein n=1 Tax=Streptomyces sp. 8K308 TaxID=2530388 RepID=UPI001051F08D|nr:hypothetical protein [Streptomyces sp. 8K308]TDC09184.1 hypothetical protein E1265_32510 [Streptomyces sp. 8K308]
MVYVRLPLMKVEGEWSASDTERALAARLVPMLPAAPQPGTDALERWAVVRTVLSIVTAVTREAGESLLRDRGPGRANMVEMTFAAARLYNEIDQYLKLDVVMSIANARTRPRRRGWLGRRRRTEPATEATHKVFDNQFLVDTESEVAELRRVLAKAAGS